MKRLMFMTAIVLASVYAQAGQLITLASPTHPNLWNYHYGSCAADGFSADGSQITGVCKYSYGSGSRYHASPTISYLATWNLDGSANALGSQCTSCNLNYQGTGTVVMINGAPYYYVATDIGGQELVNSNVQSYLYLP